MLRAHAEARGQLHTNARHRARAWPAEHEVGGADPGVDRTARSWLAYHPAGDREYTARDLGLGYSADDSMTPTASLEGDWRPGDHQPRENPEPQELDDRDWGNRHRKHPQMQPESPTGRSRSVECGDD